MPVTRKQKEELVKKVSDNIDNAKGIVITDFKGLTVSEMEELRNSLYESESGYQVLKKTLLDIALKEAKLEGAEIKKLKGQIGIAFSDGDEVSPAKISAEFAKKHENLKILGGFIEKNYLDEKSILELAKLPGKQELRAQFVMTIKAPITGFVNVLSANTRGLVNALKAIADKK